MKKILTSAIVLLLTSFFFVGCLNRQLNNKLIKTDSGSSWEVRNISSELKYGDVIQLINKKNKAFPIYINYFSRDKSDVFQYSLIEFSDLDHYALGAPSILKAQSIFSVTDDEKAIYCLSLEFSGSEIPGKPPLPYTKFFKKEEGQSEWQGLKNIAFQNSVKIIKNYDKNIVSLYTNESNLLYFCKYNNQTREWATPINVDPDYHCILKQYGSLVIGDNLYAMVSSKNNKVLDFNFLTNQPKFIEGNTGEMEDTTSSTIGTQNGYLYFTYLSGFNLYIQKYKNDVPVEAPIILHVKEKYYYLSIAIDENNNIYLGYYTMSNHKYYVEKYKFDSKLWVDITPSFVKNLTFNLDLIFNNNYPKLGYNSALKIVDLAYFNATTHHLCMATLKV